MSIKWAFGAIVAVLAALWILPGAALAWEGSISGENDGCRDAQDEWDVTWTLTNNYSDSNYEIDHFDTNSDHTPEDSELRVIDSDFADNNLTEDDFGIEDPGDGIGANESESTTETYDFDGYAYVDGYVGWTSISGTTVVAWDYVQSNTVYTPGYCIESACLDGDPTDQPVNELVDTNDCGSVRLCIGGVDGVTLSEHDAALIEGATEGSCLSPENPPPPPPVVEEEPPVEEITEVEAAVEEVAALPAAGYGATSGGFDWTAVLAVVTLLSVGGGTALVARRKS